mmetsp:Transcript_16968/g.23731  ORF Transcript_16968/g.23731 Transcript_16968/m.23731 type:complete len:263 (-) Transcript_16968:278-1066(-)
MAASVDGLLPEDEVKGSADESIYTGMVFLILMGFLAEKYLFKPMHGDPTFDYYQSVHVKILAVSFGHVMVQLAFSDAATLHFLSSIIWTVYVIGFIHLATTHHGEVSCADDPEEKNVRLMLSSTRYSVGVYALFSLCYDIKTGHQFDKELRILTALQIPAGIHVSYLVLGEGTFTRILGASIPVGFAYLIICSVYGSVMPSIGNFEGLIFLKNIFCIFCWSERLFMMTVAHAVLLLHMFWYATIIAPADHPLAIDLDEMKDS